MYILISKIKVSVLTLLMSLPLAIFAQNQTDTVSPILTDEEIPFRVRIELQRNNRGENLVIPGGIQSYVWGDYNRKVLVLSGRTNGLHGFNSGDNPSNFPPQKQNQNVYVVDFENYKVYSRSLTDPQSGLTQEQIDSLTTTAAEHFCDGKSLYVVGGYGFRNSANAYTTFDVLTAIDLPGLINWVQYPEKKGSAAEHIRQVFDEQFRVTGGWLYRMTKKDPFLLVFGQDYEGAYLNHALQVYTNTVKRFFLHDDGCHLKVKFLPHAEVSDNYRRRDLNVVAMITEMGKRNKPQYGIVALSGVFTVDTGIWTVPVTITSKGVPSMANPSNPGTFKQGMNNYASPFLSFYSKKTKTSYMSILGGISFETFSGGSFGQDYEYPFTNQCTTIKVDANGVYTQHFMDTEFPMILSTGSNAGNRLLFGAAADFIHDPTLVDLQYDHAIFKLDKIKKPTVIGHIIGGIQSTLPNTNYASDSAASPYIFKVIVEPKNWDSSCR